MKTLLYSCLLVLVVALTLTLNIVNSSPLYSMRLVKSGPHTEYVELISIKDVGKSDIILLINACGSVLEFKTSKAHMNDDDFQQFVMQNIHKVCGPL